jgi:hypothetical protein
MYCDLYKFFFLPKPGDNQFLKSPLEIDILQLLISDNAKIFSVNILTFQKLSTSNQFFTEVHTGCYRKRQKNVKKILLDLFADLAVFESGT